MSEFDIATQVSARLGDAADGSVRVWVDGLGRVQRVRIAPGG